MIYYMSFWRLFLWCLVRILPITVGVSVGCGLLLEIRKRKQDDNKEE